MNNIIQTATTYTPNWNLKRAAKDDVGYVFAKVFADLFSENEDLYEKVMKRHFILFLNLFGISKKPCKSAQSIITVKPTADNVVHVKKGTRIGSDEGAEYTTTTDLVAVNTAVSDIFSVSDDYICAGELSFFDFEGENLQKRMLLFNPGDIQTNDEIILNFFDTSKCDQCGVFAPLDLAGRDLTWEYFTENGRTEINPVCSGNTARIKIDSELSETVINGESGKWICINYPKGKLPAILNSNIAAMTVNTTLRNADSLYLNDMLLNDCSINAFGENFTLYDCFYIQSDICFSKFGSKITIELDITLNGYAIDNPILKNIIWKEIIPARTFDKSPPLHVYIENAVWEYWNGNGWKRIFNDDIYSDIFTRNEPARITFDCPGDMTNVYVGASYGLFVRCRIYKITNLYSPEMIYIAPHVKNIKIGYDYGGRFIKLKKILHCANLTFHELSSENYIEKDFSHGEVITYICFNNRINSNFLSIYFNLNKPHNNTNSNFTWQAFIGTGIKSSWVTLSKIDGTIGFTASGIINLNIPGTMQETEFFEKNGYWLRIISQNKNQPPIIFDSIEINAAEVVQEQINRPLSFTIEPFEKNKQCYLAYGNVKDITVYVTEGENNIVKWGEGDRIYSVDTEKGIVTFGDGIHSRIPPHGDNPTIRIEYTTTDGAGGNVPAGSINRFLDPIPFVDYVTNPQPAFGGKDTEDFDGAVQRGTGYVKSLGKCISADDYESFALGADDLVYRVKCIEGKIYPGKELRGAISLVVLPKTDNNAAFVHIKRNILNQILPLMPFYLARGLNVLCVKYIEFVIYTSVTINDFYEYRNVHLQLQSSLENYLNPISGGKNSNGYNIGEFPSRKELLDIVQKTEHVSRVNYLKINCYENIDAVMREVEFDELHEKIFCAPRIKEVRIVIDG